MRPLRIVGIMTAVGTLSYMAVRLVQRLRVTRIPVQEVK
jgi:hypothetical protein